LTALGGAFAAARGVGADEVIDRCVSIHQPSKTSPDERIADPLREIHEKNLEKYSLIEEEKKIAIQEG
jgi:hypothetical protein